MSLILPGGGVSLGFESRRLVSYMYFPTDSQASSGGHVFGLYPDVPTWFLVSRIGRMCW